jgi:hypothetical protein
MNRKLSSIHRSQRQFQNVNKFFKNFLHGFDKRKTNVQYLLFVSKMQSDVAFKRIEPEEFFNQVRSNQSLFVSLSGVLLA